MSIRSRLFSDFRSIFGVAPATPAPQPGEFIAPEPADVERVRAELEQIKRRLRDATPTLPFPQREGVDL